MKQFLEALHNTTKTVEGLAEKLAPLGLQCVRDNMKRGDFKANSTLTKNTKNAGARPLFDSGETYASLTYAVSHRQYRIGTNKVYASLLNDGGVIKAKRAKQLAIPVNKQVKVRTEVYGVRKTLEGLERQGWKIFYRPHSIMGRAPPGGRSFGQRVKTKANRNSKKAEKGAFYVLYIRTPKIKVPARRFMYLSAAQQQEQKQMAMDAFTQAIRGKL